MDEKNRSSLRKDGNTPKKSLNLGELIGKVIDSSSDTVSEKKEFIPPPIQPKLKILLYLKPIPWILLALFLFSFIWDFQGYHITLFQWELPLDGIIRIVTVSGLIGFLTNWTAIAMLFRPLNKRPLLGQGLIPAQKERIAYRLSLAVSEDLINPELIKRKIEESEVVKKYRERTVGEIKKALGKEEFRTEFKGWIVEYIQSVLEDDSVKKQISRDIADEIDQKLTDRPLERAAVKTYALLRGKPLEELVESAIEDIPFSVQRKIDFVDKLLDELPDTIEENSEQLDEAITNLIFNMVNRFDIQNLVEENISRYDETRLEEMIQKATNEQLKTIQYLGAVLGTIGGFVIWQPAISIVVLSLTGGAAYLIDRILYQ
jgi:uncharacterized membrane protein YheB (UPF0754 family)